MTPTPMGQEPNRQDSSRMFLAILISSGAIIAWNILFPPQMPIVPSADAGVVAQVDDPAPGAPAQPAAATPGAAAIVDAPEGAAATAVAEEKTVGIHKQVQGTGASVSQAVRGGFQATLSTKGAQLSGFELDGYGDPTRAKTDENDVKTMPNVDLARTVFPHGVQQFSLVSAGTAQRPVGDVRLRADADYEIAAQTPSSVTFRRLTEAGVTISRQYIFEDGRFGFDHELTLENTSSTPKVVALDLVVTASTANSDSGALTTGFMGMGSRDPLTAGCSSDGEREGFDVSDLGDKEEIPHVEGPIDHAAASLQYFTAAFLPDDASTTSGCTAVGTGLFQPEGEDGVNAVTVGTHFVPVTLAPGEKRVLRQRAFMGPKQLQLLQAEGHQLEEDIEFGIFVVLSRPILSVLVWLYGHTGNFGIAIILLTILIKLLTFPLTQKSYTSMQQMKTIAPMMKELQEKYGSDRATLGQKQMEMYKEKGINPLAGCLPMLVQMPIWFALYRTIWNSVELYQMPFFGWIQDLSQPDIVPAIGVGILPFVVGALMFFQTSMQPPPEGQPQLKYVLWAMPVMFTFFMFSMPSGLSVYMVTNSALTLVQQLYIKKKFGTPESLDAAAKAKAAAKGEKDTKASPGKNKKK